MKNIKLNNELSHYVLSVIVHLLIIVIIVLFQWDYSSSPGGGFIQVSSMGQPAGDMAGKTPAQAKPEDTKNQESEKTNEETPNDKTGDGNTGSGGVSETAGAGGFLDGQADTTALQYVYKESTRNVSIKYPAGWTYLDQNVKSKLDGVTFWYGGGNINPPPYIFLEVKEKYLFNEKSFKYKSDQGHHIFYYNDPTELAGQVSQIIYVRTETDEDYSIKLIIQGWDAFNAFKSTFYGVIKTFKFGRSFF